MADGNRQASPVAVPQYTPGTRPEPPPILPRDDGGAQYFARAERMFSGLADEIGQVADSAASIEGRTAGAEAGLDPEFRPGRGFSIRDKAFDQAGIQTFEQTMKARIAERAQQIADEHKADPAATEKAFDKLRDEWGGTFPEARAIAQSSIDLYRLSATRSATRQLEGQQQAARKDALEQSLTARFSALDRAVYGIGLDPQADTKIAAQLQDLRADVTSAEKRGDLGPGASRKIIDAAEGQVASSRILGAFDRLPSIVSRQEFLNDFARRYSQGEGDFAKLSPDVAQKVQAAMAGRLKSEGTAAVASGNAIKGELDKLDKNAAEGLTPTPDAIAALRAQAASASDPQLAARLGRSEAIFNLAETGRRMTPGELDAHIAEINKTMVEKGSSPDAVALRDTGVKLLKTMREELERDPLGWSERVGLLSAPPIDFTKPNAGLQMAARGPQAEAIAGYYGLKPTYLHPQEKQDLERLTAQGGDTMLAVAGAITQGFGDRAPKVLAELGVNAPVLAHTGGLLQTPGSAGFAQDVAAGVKLKADQSRPAKDRAIDLPSWLTTPPAKMQAAQTTQLRDVFGDAFILAADTEQAASQSARYAFSARAIRQGFDPALDNANSKTAFARAAQEAAGARFAPDGTQYGGVATYKPPGWWTGTAKVVVPQNIRADSFRDVIGAIQNDDIKTLPTPPKSASGQIYSAKDFQQATPVATRGGYRFALGDPKSPDPKWIRGADGAPFVLDLDQMPALRTRVPRAFLGGQ